MAHRCGTVAIIGRPNVGKSTLLNRFLGQKIAIVSPKPETTRERLLGILTLPEAQILFLDTPGIYRGPSTLLGKHQVQAAREALAQADVVLLMTEAQAGLLDEDRQIFRLLPTGSGSFSPAGSISGEKVPDPFLIPAFLAINKVDRVRKELILPQIQEAARLYPFKEIFPLSALKGANADSLLKALAASLPERPALYPADQVTDKPVRALAQDLIREKTLLFTHEEIPHAVAVIVEEWRPGQKTKRNLISDLPPGSVPLDLPPPAQQKSTYVRATLYVERDSQKGILIGKGGGLLKRIGLEARKELERLTEGTVYLDLWVKVAKNWRKDPVMLKRLGYG